MAAFMVQQRVLAGGVGAMLLMFLFSQQLLYPERQPDLTRTTIRRQQNVVASVNASQQRPQQPAAAVTYHVKTLTTPAGGGGPTRTTREIMPKFLGRLGNQMWIYASVLGLANAASLTTVIARGAILREVFPGLSSGTYQSQDQWERDRRPSVYRQKADECGRYVEHLADKFTKLNNSILVESSFMQSYKYFSGIDKQVRREFTFHTRIRRRVDAIFQTIHSLCSAGRTRRPRCAHVGIHIRRGDLLSRAAQEKGYLPADEHYVRRAMRYFAKLYPAKRIVFVVCTEDAATLHWSRQVIDATRHSVYFATNNPAATDMALLARCDHVIITVGTFGWWAAYLSGGVATYQKRYTSRGSTLASYYNSTDYFLPQWIGL